jgi:tetratricopeptide (TPR) repeat protein
LSGIDHLQTSLRLYKQLSDSYFEALILDDIGFAYLLIGEVDKRLEYSGQSLQIHRKIGNNFGYGDCLNGYALNMLARNMFDESFELMRQARDLAYQTNNTYLLSMVTPTIGRIYMWKRNFEKAFETFQFGYRLSLATKNERWRLTGQFGMASVLCMMDGDMDQVRQYLQDIPPAGSLIYNDSVVAVQLRDATAYYAAKTGDYSTLYVQLKALTMTFKSIGPLFYFLIFTPLYAYWLGKQKNPEKAVEWLSSSDHYQSTTGFPLFLNTWSVIVDFRESLRAEMGDEKFDTLWEAGKSLDGQTVLEQINEEFASDL